MESVGQVPVTVEREVEGFVLNRLQGALLNEALRLVAHGYVSPEDVDRCVRDGLGLRWSFMGPFETIDLNAPGGVADYAARYGGFYDRLEAQPLPPAGWKHEVVARIDADRRAALPVEGCRRGKLGATAGSWRCSPIRSPRRGNFMKDPEGLCCWKRPGGTYLSPGSQLDQELSARP